MIVLCGIDAGHFLYPGRSHRRGDRTGHHGRRIHHLPVHLAAAHRVYAGADPVCGADSLSVFPKSGKTKYCGTSAGSRLERVRKQKPVS